MPNASQLRPVRGRAALSGRALLGDAFASLLVGGGLLYVWQGCTGVSAAAIGSGFLLPLLVYRFSTWWNTVPFSGTRALRLMALMGTVFWLVHLPGVPALLRTCTGFVAPVFVSWRARQRCVGPDGRSV